MRATALLALGCYAFVASAQDDADTDKPEASASLEASLPKFTVSPTNAAVTALAMY